MAPIAMAAFGLSFLLFGASHFLYRDYVASVIPAWLPAHYFWAYATGVAHLAAGLALLTRIKARLAAMALTVMFGTWVLILHLPRAVAAGTNRAEWTSLVVALACCGASWIVAGRLATAPRPIAAGDDRARRIALEPSR